MVRALAIAALLAFPAGAAARAWQPPRLLAPGGYDPAAAVGEGAGVGVVYATHAARRYGVTLRRGTGALAGDTTVVRTNRPVDSPRIAFEDGSGIAVVAWRQLHGSWGLRLRRIRPGSRPYRVFDLAAGGDSVLFPFFVPGPVNLIAWGRRSGAGAATYDVHDSTVDIPFALPAGATTEVALAENHLDGTVTAVWPAHGVLYAASTTLGMDAFGPAVPISPPGGYARDPQLVADEDGNVVAVWTDSHGDGNALLAAGKPRGGAFGRVFQIQRSTYGVTSPRATLAGNGEILVTYVSTRRRLPVAHHRGTVRLARLDPTGRHVAPLVTISPAGAPATEIVASAGEVAWASGRRIVTREIGGGGALGPVQTIAGGPATELSLAANATGRGVLTWVADGRVYASVRR